MEDITPAPSVEINNLPALRPGSTLHQSSQRQGSDQDPDLYDSASANPQPISASSAEEQVEALCNNLVDEYLSKIRATMEGTCNKFLDPASFEDLNTEIKGFICQKYENCNLLASLAILQRWKNLLQVRLEESYAEIKIVNEHRRDNSLKRWNNSLNLNTPTTPNQHSQVALGIYFGSTFSSVAVYRNGNADIIPSIFDSSRVPNYVGLTPNGDVVGEAAKRQAHEYPLHAIFDVHLLIGREFDDPVIQENMKFWPFRVVREHGSNRVSIVDPRCIQTVMPRPADLMNPGLVAVKIFEHLKSMAEHHLHVDTHMAKAVITVPAYFNNTQRSVIMDAGQLADLDVLQVVSDPIAAAIAYYLHLPDPTTLDLGHGLQPVKRHVLLYDLCGSTFDVSILAVQNGDIKIKAVKGDMHLGSEEFVQSMVEFCVEKFRSSTGVDISGRMRNSENEADSSRVAARARAARQLRRLRNTCARQMEEIINAQHEQTHTTVILDEIFGHDLNVRISRTNFEEMNRDKFERTITLVHEVLSDAGLRPHQIGEVVLVGELTRIPKIQQLLKDVFHEKPVPFHRGINPDEVVAHGAAILAAKLNGNVETGSATGSRV